MANIKSAVKKIRKDKKRTTRNKAWRSKIRTLIKKTDELVVQKDTPLREVEQSFKETQKNIDKAAKRKAIHPNKAARLKSTLARKKNKEKPAHGANKPQSS